MVVLSEGGLGPLGEPLRGMVRLKALCQSPALAVAALAAAAVAAAACVAAAALVSEAVAAEAPPGAWPDVAAASMARHV